MRQIFAGATARPKVIYGKPTSTPDVVKILLGYKDELRKRHPDCPDIRVEVVEDCGWVQYPTGIWGYVVRLWLSGPGYNEKTPNLTVYGDGTFSIR
jgi:hypothetical protein